MKHLLLQSAGVSLSLPVRWPILTGAENSLGLTALRYCAANAAVNLLRAEHRAGLGCSDTQRRACAMHCDWKDAPLPDVILPLVCVASCSPGSQTDRQTAMLVPPSLTLCLLTGHGSAHELQQDLQRQLVYW